MPVVEVKVDPQNQPPMPAQDRIWGHDCGDPPKEPPAKSVPLRCQAAPLVIGQPKRATTKLLLQDSILFHEVLNRTLLFAARPTSKREQEGPKWIAVRQHPSMLTAPRRPGELPAELWDHRGSATNLVDSE